jgi:hypothetical protein
MAVYLAVELPASLLPGNQGGPMSQLAQQNIPKDKFLIIAINLLHRYFIAAGRTPAKRLFREIHEGLTVPLTAVRMEDDSTVSFKLCMDHSEYVGQLNFSAFRGGLGVLLGNTSRALQSKQEVTVFNMDQRPGSVLFGVTGVSVADGRPSVMALGADVDGQPGTVTLRLMYLDPAQFIQGDGVAATSAG